MKKLKLISILFLGFALSTSAQMEIDHSIILTGSDTNAAVKGIKSVVNPQDATSVLSIQNGGLIYGSDTGSNNAFYLSISPAIAAYRAGMVFSFVSNQTITGPATVSVSGLGAVNIYKNYNKNLSGCDIQTGQVVMVEFDGANFQMISQLSGGQLPSAPGAITGLQTVTANQAGVVYSISTVNGASSYTWSLPAGAAITSDDSTISITVTWAETGGNVCVAANEGCGSSSNSCIAVLVDTIVNVDTAQKIIFSATGADQTWLVPNGVNTIKVKLWGAGAGGYWASGGSGGYVSGFLAVTPGQTLTIIVGKGGANGGSYGGGASAPEGGSNGGGGRAAIQITPGIDAVTAGGGGGAGGADFANPLYIEYGGAGGGLTAGAGGSGGGSGGTQNAGGAYGCNNGNCGSAGSSQDGGEGCITPYDVCEYGGGGGGGYYGGGGGGGESSTSCGSPAGGGGGGSSFIANLTGNVVNLQGTSNNTGAVNNPPNNTDSDYNANIGRGLSDSNGDDGEVVIYY